MAGCSLKHPMPRADAVPPFATEEQAQNGQQSDVMMSPLNVTQWFTANTPLPAVAGLSGALLSTDGSASRWSYLLSLPASGVQKIADSKAQIQCDRTNVDVEPASDITLGGVVPVIVDVEDGRLCVVTNVSRKATLTRSEERRVGRAGRGRGW